MTIQDAIKNGINPLKASNIDEAIVIFSKYQSLLNNFMDKCLPLNGTEKQVKWANEIRESEIRVSAKYMFCCIFERESGIETISNEKINEIGAKITKKIRTYTHAAHWINQ